MVQLELTNLRTDEVFTKGLLCQAKKQEDSHRSRLYEQLRKMEAIVKDGSCLVEYGPDQLSACMSSAILANLTGATPPFDEMQSLGTFLAEQFIPCHIGVEKMFYEFDRKTLIIPEETIGYKRIQARLKHSLRIEVTRKQ